jgi:hypothetical protein
MGVVIRFWQKTTQASHPMQCIHWLSPSSVIGYETRTITQMCQKALEMGARLVKKTIDKDA